MFCIKVMYQGASTSSFLLFLASFFLRSLYSSCPSAFFKTQLVRLTKSRTHSPNKGVNKFFPSSGRGECMTDKFIRRKEFVFKKRISDGRSRNLCYKIFRESQLLRTPIQTNSCHRDRLHADCLVY